MRDSFALDMPPSTPSPAECMAWAMGLPPRALYLDLVGKKRLVREAWLKAIAGRPLKTEAQFVRVDRLVRSTMRRLQQGISFTVTEFDTSYHTRVEGSTLVTKTRVLDAPRLPALGIQLALLLDEASMRVQKCAECARWFAVTRLGQKYCRSQCANREHSRARCGVHPQAETRNG